MLLNERHPDQDTLVSEAEWIAFLAFMNFRGKRERGQWCVNSLGFENGLVGF